MPKIPTNQTVVAGEVKRISFNINERPNKDVRDPDEPPSLKYWKTLSVVIHPKNEIYPSMVEIKRD